MSWKGKTKLQLVFNIEHLWVTMVTLVLTLFLNTLVVNMSFLSPIARAKAHFSLSDMYYDMKWPTDGTKPTELSSDITIVNVDNMSRREIAEVITEISSYHPAAIGVDVIFFGKKEDAAADRFLDSVAAATPNLLFACKLTDYNTQSGEYEGVEAPYFTTSATRLGYVNTEVPLTATVREFSMDRKLRGDTISSFVAQTTEMYMQCQIPREGLDNRRIHYEYIGFNQLEKGELGKNAHLIDNRIVLLGCMTDASDRYHTPIHEMQGTEILAYEIQTLIDQRDIREISDEWYYLLLFLVCYFSVVWNYCYTRYMDKIEKKNLVLLFLSNSKIIQRLLTFVWLAIIAWMTYVSYEKYDKFVPLALLLVVAGLVGEGRTIYKAMIKNKEFNSIYR